MTNWKVKFSYSGSGRVEYFTKEFITDNIDKTIADYIHEQNKGEAKSDRIKYHSKLKRHD